MSIYIHTSTYMHSYVYYLHVYSFDNQNHCAGAEVARGGAAAQGLQGRPPAPDG